MQLQNKYINLRINLKNKLFFNIAATFIFISILSINTFQVFAQKTSLLNISVPNEQAIVLQFDGKINWTVALDSTKTNLVYEVSNCFLSNTVNNIGSTGIFSSIQTKVQKNSILIDIRTNQKIGYTSYFNPISNELNVFIVYWGNLSLGEDYFHTGLLAFEESLDSIGLDFMYKSLREGYYNAANIIALQEFASGKVNRALKYSDIGEYSPGNFPQVLAIKSSMLKMRGDTIIARQLADKYFELTKKELPKLLVPKNRLSDDTLNIVEVKFIDSLTQLLQNSQMQSTDEYTQFNKLFDTTKAKETTSKTTQSIFNIFPFWMQVAISVVFAGLMLLLYLYVRWRTLQTKAKISKARNQSINSSREATKVTKKNIAPQHATGKYQANENKEVTPPKPNVDLTNKEQPASIFEEKAQLMTDAINSIVAQKQTESPEQSNQKLGPKKASANARTELTMNLLNEQKKIKEAKLKNIPNEIIGKSVKVKEIASKMGLEENTIEMKKAMDNALKDKSIIDKLSSKL
jgi:predicted membrane protein